MQAIQTLFAHEQWKQAVASWWRRHIIDDDPYDLQENEQFRLLLQAGEPKEKIKLPIVRNLTSA
jgi:hypothetical protein